MACTRSNSLLRRTSRRVLSGLVILWLAFFYPAVCEIHGMMLFRGATMPNAQMLSVGEHMGAHDHAAMTKCTLSDASAAPDADGSDRMNAVRFRGIPSGSTVMAMAAMAAPSNLVLRVPDSAAQLIPPVRLAGHQHDPSPPERPPRLAV
jgi:hypothetical protein